MFQIGVTTVQAPETFANFPGVIILESEARSHSKHDTPPLTVGASKRFTLISQLALLRSLSTLMSSMSIPPCSPTIGLVSPGNEVY